MWPKEVVELGKEVGFTQAVTFRARKGLAGMVSGIRWVAPGLQEPAP